MIIWCDAPFVPRPRIINSPAPYLVAPARAIIPAGIGGTRLPWRTLGLDGWATPTAAGPNATGHQLMAAAYADLMLASCCWRADQSACVAGLWWIRAP